MKTPGETMNRRTFLKKTTQGAAVLATASMGPWFIKDALSSSGTLNPHLKKVPASRSR
jgi:hypothetical protein